MCIRDSHYQMGYQMVAYGYDRYGGEIWDKTLRYGVRNAYMPVSYTHLDVYKRQCLAFGV